MISELKNRRSLALYMDAIQQNDSKFNQSYNFSPILVSLGTSEYEGNIIWSYNQQLKEITDTLGMKRTLLNEKVTNNLKLNPQYDAARQEGVNLAWDYEKADVQMGGKGSAKWNRTQQQEILERGRVRGAEGHHQKNVADHPEGQANPDNIKFYKSREDHLMEGHDGSFHNSTDGPFIDKNKMLQKTNAQRVMKQEIKGLGVSAALGLGIGFSLSFIAELARSEISVENIKEALIYGGLDGIETAVISSTGYGIGIITQKFLQNQLALDLYTNAGMFFNSTVSGLLIVAVLSAYQFAKLTFNGVETKDAMRFTGKSAVFSLSSLSVSIIAQSVLGGYAGIIVSTAIGLSMFSISMVSTVKERYISSKIREYAVEQYRALIPWRYDIKCT